MTQQDDGGMTYADLESVRASVEILRLCKEKEAALKELKTAAEEAIKEALGHREIGKLDGENVVTWTSHKKRQLDQKALKEAHPDLVDSYTMLVEARTFKVVPK